MNKLEGGRNEDKKIMKPPGWFNEKQSEQTHWIIYWFTAILAEKKFKEYLKEEDAMSLLSFFQKSF